MEPNIDKIIYKTKVTIDSRWYKVQWKWDKNILFLAHFRIVGALPEQSTSSIMEDLMPVNEVL